MTGGIALFFFLSFSLFVYIFFSSCSRRAVAVVAYGCSAQQKEAACKMERGMRDNWPIIVDRDDTRVLSRNYSRTVAQGRIQFGVASTLAGKKRDEMRTTARRTDAEEDERSNRSLLFLLVFQIRGTASCMLVDGNAHRSLEMTYLMHANASWFHRRIVGD